MKIHLLLNCTNDNVSFQKEKTDVYKKQQIQGIQLRQKRAACNIMVVVRCMTIEGTVQAFPLH
jgi:hypothetical protein